MFCKLIYHRIHINITIAFSEVVVASEFSMRLINQKNGLFHDTPGALVVSGV
jgi:hypothetical protein